MKTIKQLVTAYGKTLEQQVKLAAGYLEIVQAKVPAVELTGKRVGKVKSPTLHALMLDLRAELITQGVVSNEDTARNVSSQINNAARALNKWPSRTFDTVTQAAEAWTDFVNPSPKTGDPDKVTLKRREVSAYVKQLDETELTQLLNLIRTTWDWEEDAA